MLFRLKFLLNVATVSPIRTQKCRQRCRYTFLHARLFVLLLELRYCVFKKPVDLTL